MKKTMEKTEQYHTHNCFTVLWILSGTNWVSRYRKKHSLSHIYPDHQSSFICFLHLLQSTASFLFNLHAWTIQLPYKMFYF